MKYQVKLRYFEDEGYGQKGFTHHNTYNLDTPFNAFTDISGVFHDVFEHYFEGSGIFINNNIGNIFGEAVATGHKFFYYHELGINAFMFRKYKNYLSGEEDWTVDTRYLFQEAFKEDYSEYPYHIINIPYQKPINCLAYIERYYKDFFIEKCNLPKSSPYHQQIANAYRLGYNMAYKKWGSYSKENKIRSMMLNFLNYWNKTLNDAKTDRGIDNLSIDDEYAYPLKYLLFTLNTCKPSWKCELIDDIGNTYNLKKLIIQ